MKEIQRRCEDSMKKGEGEESNEVEKEGRDRDDIRKKGLQYEWLPDVEVLRALRRLWKSD